MKKRIQIQSIPISIKNKICEIISTKEEKFEKQEKASGSCEYCDWWKNRKTKAVCGMCRAYICKEHTEQVVCINCQNVNEEQPE